MLRFSRISRSQPEYPSQTLSNVVPQTSSEVPITQCENLEITVQAEIKLLFILPIILPLSSKGNQFLVFKKSLTCIND